MVRAWKWPWMTRRSTLKLKVIGFKSQGQQVKKRDLRSHLITLQVIYEVMGRMAQGQRSHGSRSKVPWARVSINVIILAGGLTSTSSCFIVFFCLNRSRLRIVACQMM